MPATNGLLSEIKLFSHARSNCKTTHFGPMTCLKVDSMLNMQVNDKLAIHACLGSPLWHKSHHGSESDKTEQSYRGGGGYVIKVFHVSRSGIFSSREHLQSWESCLVTAGIMNHGWRCPLSFYNGSGWFDQYWRNILLAMYICWHCALHTWTASAFLCQDMLDSVYTY